MASTPTATRSPDVSERVLATMLPEMLPEAERPTERLDSFWWRADWTDVEEALDAGRVLILSVESGWDAAAAMTCALYQCGGDLVFRHDPAKARLYLSKRKPAEGITEE